MYLFGEEQRIVGISAFTCRPPQAKEQKPVVSGFTGGNKKKILDLKPDLVVGFSDIQADLARDLIAAHLPVLIFNQRSLQEILDVILMLGRLVGAHTKAEALVQSYSARLNAAKSRAAARKAKPRVYFEEWDEPMISCIQWVSELIELAGGEDVFAAKARGHGAKDRFVTNQEVRQAQPDVMIASWCGKPFDRQIVDSREGFAAIPALKNNRVFELDPSIILQPGPACLTDGLAALEALLQ